MESEYASSIHRRTECDGYHSLLIDRSLAGKELLEVAANAEEGVLHIIGRAIHVARHASAGT